MLPIVKNTYTGIRGTPPELLEAARGIGLTKFQVLGKVQFPLALPVIMAGVRISAVSAVGLVTIAAFIGAGGVSFYQVMPTYHNPTGKKAYIMNMYTAPAYRRQGIAFHTLDLLVKDIRKQGVSQITLEATEMGRPLYEKYGFIKMVDEMELIK